MTSPAVDDEGGRTYRFSVASELAAPAPEVWAHAMTIRGVNRELFPLARMTCPAELGRDLSRAPLGRRACRSWILVGGILPVDYDDVTFVERDPGRRFLECSPMLSQREWRHERIIESYGGGSIVIDRVEFVTRVPSLGPVFLRLFHLAFRLRHRNLRRLFPRRDGDGRLGALLRPAP
jgi:hypothetical protein